MILFNYLCSVLYWARKNVGVIDPKCAQSTADKRRICLKSSVPHKNEVSPWTTHGALYEAKAFSTPEKPPLDHGRRMLLPPLHLWEPPLLLRLLLQLFPWVSLKYLRLQMLPCSNIKTAAKLSSAQRKAAALRQNSGKNRKKIVCAREIGNWHLIFSSLIRKCK